MKTKQNHPIPENNRKLAMFKLYKLYRANSYKVILVKSRKLNFCCRLLMKIKMRLMRFETNMTCYNQKSLILKIPYEKKTLS